MDLSNWKATQFRFLLYAGGIVLRDVLEAKEYKHFLLLYTSRRIKRGPRVGNIRDDEVTVFLFWMYALIICVIYI